MHRCKRFLAGFMTAILLAGMGTATAFSSPVQEEPIYMAQLGVQPMSESLLGSSRKEKEAKTRSANLQRPAVNPSRNKRKGGLDPKFLPQVVSYSGPEKPGTIVVDTANRFLYLVEGNGKARRYGIGVGRQGFT